MPINPLLYIKPFDYSQKDTDSPHRRFRTIMRGLCVSNIDEKNNREVRIRLFPIDKNIKNKELPVCIPILPPHLYVHPQINEMCIVMFGNPYYPYRDRYFIGPIIGLGEVDKKLYDETYDDFISEEQYKITGQELGKSDKQSEGYVEEYTEGLPIE